MVDVVPSAVDRDVDGGDDGGVVVFAARAGKSGAAAHPAMSNAGASIDTNR